MKIISADYILDSLNGKLLKDHVLVLNGNEVVDFCHKGHASEVNTFYSGILSPGFINTHCHLELSHMKGVIPSGTGLINFLEKVVSLRAFPQEVIDSAISDADSEMKQNGIVAVGDICNTSHTVQTKKASSITYYSFVEMFDLLNETITDSVVSQYSDVFEQHNNPKSIVPHAPYSVSEKLFKHLNNNKTGVSVSIHNQEVQDENDLFLNGGGDLHRFYNRLNMPLSGFQPIGTNSINYALQNMNSSQKSIFVHNTMTTKEDVRNAHTWSEDVFWATCPNANLYIENRLPDYKMFVDEGCNMTIGTDSLSSNWQLCIWEEIKTIKKYNDFLPLEMLMTWGTINGAESLGMGDVLGSFGKGKCPGVLHINATPESSQEEILKSRSELLIGC